ncbi:MAG: amidohydrolase family protein [Candidatus Dormibacteraeota bacterium]|uniref:Amidohydrolase family protein n=1 Tax=Candidatus Dormiibacter inghamiae TaxID=3127013 RepID=A0A934N7S1_9BACT|nr:amidohydrolase family protein [Candidatus Dormibacteraeota bacterium]MBJ7604761.1 amidohydrolase family protein [Candidatus Dormibacteraeota bacterium]
MPTAVRADALLDPETAESLRPATVLIEGGRVVAAGHRDEIQVPRDAVVVDAEGLTLLPGLIDCHVHLCFAGSGLDLGERLAAPASLVVLQAVDSCRKTINAGFTTVRDAGGTPNGVRLAVERGLFPGPRMVLAIQILSQTGGHADNHFPCGVTVNWNPTPDLPPPVVDGVEPMRQRVRHLIREGADWIKLCTSGGVLSPGDSPHHATFSQEEITAAVTEAATQGRRVMAHAQAAAGIKNALRAGVATIEHGIWIDDEALQLFSAGGQALVPTLVAPRWVIRHAETGRMPAWAAAKAQDVGADHDASIKRAIEAGVEIAFGTDTGVGPQGTMGEEFLLLRQLGLPADDCLRTATTVAARVLRLENQVGTLKVGAHADLVGVPGDPLQRLELLADPASVHLVVKSGEVVKARPT